MRPATTRDGGSVLDRLTASATRLAARNNRGPLIYRQLGYQLQLALSAYWPVRVTCGPHGTSPSPPASCDVHRRRIYLDLDTLLASREELEARDLQPRPVTRTVGVALHELGHARHSLPWVIEQIARHEDPVLLGDGKLLEEPRMEASLLRQWRPDSRRGGYLRTAIPIAVADIHLPLLGTQLHLTQAAGTAAAREVCGQLAGYVLGRCHAGTLPRAVWEQTVRGPVEQVLGRHDLQALEQILADVVLIDDDDPDSLIACARRWRTVLGDPPTDEQPRTGTGEPDPSGNGSGSEGTAGEGPVPGSLEEALQEAIDAAQQQTEPATGSPGAQHAEQLTGRLRQATTGRTASDRAASDGAGAGGGVGLPGGRLPDLGTGRPPTASERRFADELARRLRDARVRRQRIRSKRSPGGRYDPRAGMRARAQRRLGLPVTAEPWQLQPPRRQRLQGPHVLLIVDTSGSMSVSEPVLGSLVWVLTDAIRQIDGRLCTTAFGNGLGVVHDGHRPLRTVPGLRTDGGTGYGPEALEIGARHLRLHDPIRPRLVFVLSDGGWVDTAAGVERIRQLQAASVAVVQLTVGAAPLVPLACDEQITVTSADEAATEIADGVSAALATAR